ncbi:MAG: hypothetical protein ACREDF_02490 [Thermoplasmata archaeon]
MQRRSAEWFLSPSVMCAGFLLCLGVDGICAEQPADRPSAESAAPTSGPSDSEEGDAKNATEGIWPSKRLLRSLLARRAEDVAREYGFDEEQRTKAREAIVDGWGQFLGERRERLQPLLNEFLEMRLDVEPPPKERVQAWAEKAGPAFEELRDQAGKSVGALRQIVKPDQRIAFEVEAVKLQAGLALAGAKLYQWRSGEFDAKDFWEPLPSERRREREKAQPDPVAPSTGGAGASSEESSAAASDNPAVEDQIAVELTSWDTFAAEFMARYALDPAQRDAVRSCLTELKERAAAHRDRHREEIAQLERRIAASRGEDAEVEAVRRDVVTLYGPIDEMFAELKRRIEPIPTTEQRDAGNKRRGDLLEIPPRSP